MAESAAKAGGTNNIEADANQLINLEELYVSSGWFDPNISFGEPGFEERETLENGLLTAAKSGFTHVLLNPNTNPKTSTLADVNHLIQSTLSHTTKLHVSAVLSNFSLGIVPVSPHLIGI